MDSTEPRPAEEPLNVPPGHVYEEAPDRPIKPMTPELQQILDDAKSAGFEVWGDLDDAIFIVKHRAGDVPTGLQIMPDHAAFRVAEPSNMEEIHDYSVMRSVLKL
jgi:hypothetical protein